MTVCEFGTYEGGLYMVPEYGLGIDVREGDLVRQHQNCAKDRGGEANVLHRLLEGEYTKGCK